MTDTSSKPKNDSSEETVIGFKGSEQHHDLKNQPGENADADHAEGEAATDKEMRQAVENTKDDGPVAEALKDAISHK